MTGYRLPSPPVPFQRAGKRVTNRDYLADVRRLSCLSCGLQGHSQASHVRMGSHRHGKPNPGMGRRPDDRWVIPQCNDCHMEMHAAGEQAYWEALGVDVLEVAWALYEAQDDPGRMAAIVRRRKPRRGHV